MGHKNNKPKKPSAKRKRLERELELCEAKSKVLFENMNSGVAIYEAKNDGKDFVFTDFNPAA